MTAGSKSSCLDKSCRRSCRAEKGTGGTTKTVRSSIHNPFSVVISHVTDGGFAKTHNLEGCLLQ